jgi:hypothetical protein
VAHDHICLETEDPDSPVDETFLMAKLLGVSYELAFALDYFHSEEEVSAQSLVDNWLRAGEFDFGDDEAGDSGESLL